ncbi:NAD-dependent epimerase/dehydratase family protein [Haladaptatus halobius]|uniref:NAD-dependent epimerase/dehydratase family protein n=1 Tax=Haladaptatus halobius TaxID=2884875 RepID=UPI001D0B8FE9|nr:NAD-dependent epimerase/dehydratase family protein [Haladaptatus halobius]
MNILVTGGDGFVGRNLCRELADDGHDLTVLSRTPDPSVLPDGTETVAGDVMEYESIADAFAGQDVVVHLVALSPLFQHPDEPSQETVQVDGTRNTVRAAIEHDLDYLVQMSSVGVDPSGETGYVRGKAWAEWVALTADIDTVIFRPNIMFGDADEFSNLTELGTFPYVTPLPDGGQTPFQPLWVGDTAAIIADTIGDDNYLNGIYELAGPEELTLADTTRRIHRSKGQPVTILPLPMKFVEAGLLLAHFIPQVPFGIDQARSLKMDLTSSRNDLAVFDRNESDLLTFDAYLERS